jgi:hypothetical protein
MPTRRKFPCAKPCRPLSAVEIKAIVRHRDGYRCTECGMTAEQHKGRYGKNLDVHRVEPGSPYTVHGCQTLCRSCHSPKPRSPLSKKPYKSVKLSRGFVFQLKQIAFLTRTPLHVVLSDLLREPPPDTPAS